ncbi:MAG: hypothetical protein EP335_01335 [Alphaproteobacteria bacterium]|nr:MAG: hypothetical protein EP335_01335 [Alphaproteobacteria bacterium]
MTELTVTTTNDEDYNDGGLAGETNDGDGLSLREALAVAESGDIITFAESLSGQTITLGGTELTIDTSLSIDGDLDDDGVPDIVVSGDDRSRVISITSGDVTLEGITVSHGLNDTDDDIYGAGIFAGSGVSSLTLQSVEVSDNVSLVLDDDYYIYGGGVYSAADSLTISGSSFHDNTANQDYGGSAYGGGLYVERGEVLIVNSSFVGNASIEEGDYEGAGGGFYIDNGVTSVVIDTVVAAYNRGYSGVQIDADTTVNSSTFTGNAGDQVSIAAGATVTFTNTIAAASGGDASVEVNVSATAIFGENNILSAAPTVASHDVGGTATGDPTIEADLGNIFYATESRHEVTGSVLVTRGIVQYGMPAGDVSAGANVPATLNNLDGAPSHAAGDDPVTLDNNVTVTDIELDGLNNGSGNYNGATLTIARHTGPDTNDVFSIANTGSISTADGVIYVDRGAGGGPDHAATYTTSSGTLYISFDGTLDGYGDVADTSSLVNSILQRIQYAYTGETSGDVRLDWAFNDGSGAPNATVTGATTVSVTGNTPAVIGGETTGRTDEDATGTVTGSLTITDDDGTDQESFCADTIEGTYGDLIIDASGNWSYDLDESNGDVQATRNGDSLEDTITVHSVDGTEQDIVITIDGEDDYPTLTVTAEDPDFLSGGSGVTLFSNADSSAVDNGLNPIGLTIRITGVTDGANEVLTADGVDIELTNGFTTNTSTLNFPVIVQLSGSTALVTFVANDVTTDQMNDMIDGMTYRNDSETVTGGTRTVTITNLRDNGNVNSDASLSLSSDVSVEQREDIIVTTADDVVDANDGVLSLREAVALANNTDGADTILFDNSLAGQTITLTVGQLTLNESVTIDGDVDGDDKADITISGDDTYRIFGVNTDGTVTLNSLTVEGGYHSASAGAIYSALGATININDSTFEANYATHFGGVLAMSTGVLNITNSLFSGNSADDSGGAIYTNGVEVNITSSTFTRNQSDGNGGAAYLVGVSDVSLDHVTIIGNAAEGTGNDIYGDNGTTLTIDNSIVGSIGTSGAGATVDVIGPVIKTEGWTATTGGGFVETVYVLEDLFDSVTTISLGTGNLRAGVLADNGQTVDTIAIKSGGNADDTASDGGNIGAGPDGNEAAVIGGDLTGNVDEDATGTIGGSLTISDADGTDEEVFCADTLDGTYGDLTIDANGDWLYDLDESNDDVQALGADDTLSDTITVRSADGTEQDIVITIGGENDAASFGGDLSGSLGEDDDTIGGTATVSDVDSGEASFTPDTLDGSHGQLVIDANGDWTYDLNSSNADVQGMVVGETLTDTITVTSADGTEQDIAITIDGANDAPTLSGLTTLEYTEGDGVTVIDSDVTFFDADSDFDGATLKISGWLPEDGARVSYTGTGPGQIDFSAGYFTFGGTPFATVAVSSDTSYLFTFNENASNESIEALIESLAYLNRSDDPTVSHLLTIDFTDAHGNDLQVDTSYTQVTGDDRPFAGMTEFGIAPALADIDGDGDLDTVIGLHEGTFRYYENTGTASSPVFTEVIGSDNPLNLVDIGESATPTFVDIDGDGDLDLFTGELGASIKYYENTGNADSPVFEEVAGSDNPFDSVTIDSAAAIAFVDIDNDGDMDAFVGRSDGLTVFVENTGNADSPAFTPVYGTDNPLNGVDSGYSSRLSFVDFDGDGDMDVFIGGANGLVVYYENTGNADSPVFTQVTGSGNPFDGIDVGYNSVPVLADIDDDGDLDAVIGSYGSGVFVFNASNSNDVSIAVTGVNDAATFGGDLTGTVSEDATDAITGTATISDVDSAATFNADTIEGTYGDLVIDANGDWSYDLDENNSDVQALGADDTLSDTITVTSADGTEQDIVITIDGENDAATFGGDLAGNMDEDSTGTIDGTAQATDIDTGESGFTADTIDGSYGSLTIDAGGNWVYDLDESHGDVQALADGETLVDSITVAALDGTEQDIDITIHGANDTPASSGGSISATEHQTASFTASDFGFTDTDTSDSLASVRIDSLPDAGTLTLSGNAVQAGDVIDLADIANLGYTPANNVDGDRSFTFSVSDGTAWSDTATMAVDVTGVNDTPFGLKLTSGGVTENQAGVLVGTLRATDPEGGSLTYSIAGDDRFIVVGDKLYLREGVSLDYEAGASISLRAYAVDAGGLTIGAVIHVNVLDVVEGVTSTGTAGDDTLAGTSAGDTLTGGAGNDTLDGGAGDDFIKKDDSDPGEDTLVGGEGGDVIHAGGGNDFVVGDGASDGATRQSLIDNSDTGADGADTIRGGDGDDTLLGGGWDDDLIDDNGVYDEGEEVESGSSPNIMWAGGGNDIVVGSGGADRIGGNTDDDYVKGLGGDDTLFGNTGNDTLLGGDGDDQLFNGEDDDLADGGAGDDTIWAGAGDDTLTGGAGADVFCFGQSAGNDIITDFNTDVDSLDLTARGITDTAALGDAASEATVDGQAGLLLDLGDGETVFLKGLGLADVDTIGLAA